MRWVLENPSINFTNDPTLIFSFEANSIKKIPPNITHSKTNSKSVQRILNNRMLNEILLLFKPLFSFLFYIDTSPTRTAIVHTFLRLNIQSWTNLPSNRCRDEGPRRLKVHWARADGRPMKIDHSDHRGRLTLPHVTVEDAGVYLCIPLSSDGQDLRLGRKSATLVVNARVYPSSHAPHIPPHPFNRSYERYYNYFNGRRQRRQRPLEHRRDQSQTVGQMPDALKA